MKRILTSIEVMLPDHTDVVSLERFKANAAIILRAVFEDSLHDDLRIPHTETHKYIGRFSMTVTQDDPD